MVASEPWRRKTPMRRTAARRKPGKNTGPTRQSRNDVWRRAGNCCERCGKYLYPDGPLGSYSIHHRRPRGMGGSKQPWINDESNLLLVCGSGTTGCHGWIESNRDDSYYAGWLVHSWEDPWDIPVLVHSRHPLRRDPEHERVYLVAKREDGSSL